MSGRPSAAVERAIQQYGLELRARRSNNIRTTRADRINLAKDAAVLEGIHYTTLARALGLYKKGANGHVRRTAAKRS